MQEWEPISRSARNSDHEGDSMGGSCDGQDRCLEAPPQVPPQSQELFKEDFEFRLNEMMEDLEKELPPIPLPPAPTPQTPSPRDPNKTSAVPCPAIPTKGCDGKGGLPVVPVATPCRSSAEPVVMPLNSTPPLKAPQD